MKQFKAIVFVVAVVNALDLDGAKEQPCFEISKTAPVDIDFLSSTGIWYYPMMSKLELYSTALELTPEHGSEDLQENDLYYDSCLRFEQPTLEDPYLVTGFNGKHAEYTFNPVNNTKDSEVQSCHVKTPSGKSGSTFLTLTDNSTFFFTAICWDDNQMSWGVASPHQSLPKETVTLIHDHAESLGFDKKFFTGIQYSFCKFPETVKKSD